MYQSRYYPCLRGWPCDKSMTGAMNRRSFLETVGALTVAAAHLPPRVSRQPRSRKNWIWMRPRLNRTTDEWTRDFALMRASGIHAIVPEVWNGREAFYRSRRVPVRAAWLETALPL